MNDVNVQSQNFPIDISLVKPAYCILDEMQKQMPHKFFIELLGHYISEDDQRRREVYSVILKYAEIDGVVLSGPPNAGDNRASQEIQP